ncbi:MAG: CAP domain-containing protein [Acidimicrobiales bacterium]
MLSVAALAAVGVSVAAGTAGSEQAGSVQRSRNEVHADYLAAHATVAADPGWTGDGAACDAGTISVAYQQQQVDRINYYRRLAGLEHDVELDTGMSAEAQEAALIIWANAAVDHNPSPSAACYSETGATGSFNSDLYQRTGFDALRGFMEDPGEANVSVGHRNWLLMPQLRSVGIGEVPTTASEVDGGYAVNFRNGFELEKDTAVVAWPSAGYFPEELVDERWSVSIYGADFSNASVAVRRDGEPIDAPIVFNERRPGVLPASIITFTPEGIDDAVDGRDTRYEVSITGVVSDVGSTIEYEVVTFDAEAPLAD